MRVGSYSLTLAKTYPLGTTVCFLWNNVFEPRCLESQAFSQIQNKALRAGDNLAIESDSIHVIRLP
jgi:hypothetical protein